MAFVLKAKYEQDIRRLSFQNVPSFEQLETVIRNLFSIPQDVPFSIRYEDEDKDLITISSGIELEEAISLMSKQKPITLRLLISKVSEKKDCGTGNSPISFEIPFLQEILKNPQLLTQLLSCPEIIATLQQKLSGCKDLSTNMNDLIQQFGKLGMNFNPTDQTTEQMRQQMQVFLQSILEIPFVQHLINSAKTQCPKPTTSGHSNSSNEEPVLHIGVVCDNCDETIIGTRYKCSNCPDFDLCEKCEPLGVHYPDHVFLKIKKPLMRRGCPYRRPDSVGQNWRNYRSRARTTTVPTQSKEEFPLGRFVSNVSVKDGAEFLPGYGFVKIWKMRNEGTVPWPENSRLVFVGGDKLSASEAVDVVSVLPGEFTEIAVEMTAPSKPGRYVSYWRLAQPNGDRFGQRVWVDIIVSERNQEIQEEEEMLSEPAQEVGNPDIVEEVPQLISPEDSNIQKFLELGFTDVPLIRSLLEVNQNDFFRTLDDLFKQQHSSNQP